MLRGTCPVNRASLPRSRSIAPVMVSLVTIYSETQKAACT